MQGLQDSGFAVRPCLLFAPPPAALEPEAPAKQRDEVGQEQVKKA